MFEEILAKLDQLFLLLLCKRHLAFLYLFSNIWIFGELVTYLNLAKCNNLDWKMM